MKIVRALLIPFVLLTAGAAHAMADDLRSVSGMQFHYRVVLAFAPSLADRRLTAQRGVMAQIAIEASKRNLVFLQADPRTVIGSNDKPGALRLRFKVPASAYRTLLIDKNGKVILSSAGPIAGAAIIRAIDAAPDRQMAVRPTSAGRPSPAQ